ncbi:unnamed protein product [Kluyveromyces dobzhanskii CBS 2104]|uniref:WGS project CCBQ000000000 data, contig 00099 n=1 Tax=Kluyveromyces dobzhanskii CBS 2104 TaxID=1427455 RepID=A0A0A8L1Y8_9SACH|nr:unnamed protein product [Kluyveromyces dobzhanskii CBS 2104]
MTQNANYCAEEVGAPLRREDEESQAFELGDMSSTQKPVEDTTEFIADHSELRYNDTRPFWEKVWCGPINPKDESPKFFIRWKKLKFLNELPIRFNESKLGGKAPIRYGILIVHISLWFGIVFSLLFPFLLHPPVFIDKESHEVSSISSLTCTQPLRSWKGDNNACGINAELCESTIETDTLVRCPALCDRAWIYSAITVGNQRVKYREFNIGGGPAKESDYLSQPYRGDSAVCSSAYHSGLISGLFGGCVRVSKQGPQSTFPSANGKSGSSVSFDSFFPTSFSFTTLKDGVFSGCYDLRSLIMVLNIAFSFPVFFFYKSIIGYWTITLTGFWTLLLVFDPPILTDPTDLTTVAELISTGFERLLPLCFILYVIWKASVKRTLQDGSPLVKATLWFPMFWLGVMNNVTFDRLPVDRLAISDLKELAGALLAVGSILATILICAVIQAYSIWKSGRFAKYFKILISVILGLVALSMIPGLSLRIHHYILGMTLVMFCSTRGASAYLFQGILIGLVISGIGTWGFASIVETNWSLLRGEAGAAFGPPIFNFNASQPLTISWHPQNATAIPHELDGYSLLINDVERYVGSFSWVDLESLIEETPSFAQLVIDAQTKSENNSVPFYLRVAHANTKDPIKKRGDYTNAAILQFPEGLWQDPPPGVS